MDFRSSSGRYARSRHLAESHPQVLIIAPYPPPSSSRFASRNIPLCRNSGPMAGGPPWRYDQALQTTRSSRSSSPPCSPNGDLTAVYLDAFAARLDRPNGWEWEGAPPCGPLG